MYTLGIDDNDVNLVHISELGNPVVMECTYCGVVVDPRPYLGREMRRLQSIRMDTSWLQQHMEIEGTRLLEFQSIQDIDDCLRYVTDHAKCDFLDISIVPDDTSEAGIAATYTDMCTLVREVFPQPKHRDYAFGDMHKRRNLYADGSKVIGISRNELGIRVFAVGDYAQIMKSLVTMAFHLPVSLSAQRKSSSKFPQKLLESVSIKVNQPRQYLFHPCMPSNIRLHRLDVCLDITKKSTSFESIVNVAVQARNKQRGKRMALTILGTKEYGRSVYIGKRSSAKQWCIYEKNKQTSKKYRRDTHTRIELRYRPKRNKNSIPEMAAFLSVAEVFFQSKLTPTLVKYLKSPVETEMPAEVCKLLED